MKFSQHNIPFAPALWPFFYGWFILLAGTAGIIFSSPGQTIGVAAFTEPLIGSHRITFFFVVIGNGLSSATFGPLIGVHCARFFGRKHLGAISGLQMTFNVLASAGGPALFALSLRFTDSYRAILILCIVTAAALAASIKPARPPLYPHPSKA